MPISPQPSGPYSYELFKVPSILTQLGYMFRSYTYIFLEVIKKLMNVKYRWNVAYQFCSDWVDAVLWKSFKIPNPPNRFLADPFIAFVDEKHVCYVEDFNYEFNKAVISAYEIDKFGAKYLGTALEENFHLSFPFIFEDSGQLFMCPESHKNNDIRLYKCDEFPMKWSLYSIIKRDVSAADSMILKHDNKWWVLTNIDTSNIDDHHSELHIYYANSLDSTDWKPHKGNPVIFDSKCARNGGLLFKDSDIFRVFQVQDFNTYGKSMGIAKITNLTPDNYCEDIQFNISGNFFENVTGTHTFSHKNNLLAFDYSVYK